MNLLPQLLELQELFSDPARWTQKAMARDKNGQIIASDSPGAVAWCIAGGIFKVAGKEGHLALFEYIRDFAPQRFPIWVNDTQGYEAVVALIKRAVVFESCEVECKSWGYR